MYTQINKISKLRGKCKFKHIGVTEIYRVLEKLTRLETEIVSLKTELNLKHYKMKNMEVSQKVEKMYGVHALEKVEKKVAYSSFFKEKSSKIQNPGSILIATNTSKDEKCDNSNNNEHFTPIQCGRHIKQETDKENETKLMKQNSK